MSKATAEQGQAAGMELDRLARKYADEQGVSYGQGLRIAQRLHRNLAQQVAARLSGLRGERQ